MTRSITALGLGFGALILAAHHASAQPNRNCAPRDAVISKLSKDYGETRQTIGLGGQSQVVETYASRESGTWTIIITLPSGISCVVAAGQSFENTASELVPTGDPA